jgi:hypothetical protein
VGEFEAPTVKLNSLKVGSVSLDASDIEAVQERSGGEYSFAYNIHCDGNLGYGAFSRHTLEVNFERQTLILHPRSVDLGKRTPDGVRTFLAKMLPTGHQSIELEVFTPYNKRMVMALEGDRWLVIDALTAKESHHYALHWLLHDFPYEQKDNLVLLSLGINYKIQVGVAQGDAAFSLLRADPNSTRGWRSRYYGHKEPAISLRLESDQKNATFWTFFGFENDIVEIAGNELRINSKPYSLVE